MCTQDVNTKKGFCIPSDTYIGFFSVPDHTGYLVRSITPPWENPLCCDDLHLSGAYMFFPTQGRLFYFTKYYF